MGSQNWIANGHVASNKPTNPYFDSVGCREKNQNWDLWVYLM